MQDSKSTESFANDREFLAYVETHSRTPRCLFHIDHIVRFAELAGTEIDRADFPASFYSMDYEFVAPKLATAYARLEQPSAA